MTIDVPRETWDRLEHLQALVIEETGRQNLVSAATIPDFRTRHISDSLQLLVHVQDGLLLDIGSGAGFPGLALACCRSGMTHLVEPRKRRANFLSQAAESLGIADRVTVHHAKVERISIFPAATITARAVAPLTALFAMAEHIADANTRWLLPKGQTAVMELEAARQTWQGGFRLIPSATNPDAAILIAENVRRRRAR
jgi:16S rRNA (guanine527-N7)-methyltransferase